MRTFADRSMHTRGIEPHDSILRHDGEATYDCQLQRSDRTPKNQLIASFNHLEFADEWWNALRYHELIGRLPMSPISSQIERVRLRGERDRQGESPMFALFIVVISSPFYCSCVNPRRQPRLSSLLPPEAVSTVDRNR